MADRPRRGDPVALGVVSKPLGLSGAVRVRPYGDGSLLLAARLLWVREDSGEWRPRSVRRAALQGGAVLVRFADVATPEEAEALRGREVGLPRSEFPSPAPGEHYWADLIGLRVQEEGASEPRGEVAGLMPMPGADNLIVRDADGAEWMLPFVREYVAEVDLPGGRIVVRIPEGLLD